ncbi:MAG: AAA family ATPase [Campylobacterota bacterium]|nr:AAA family ATPase [Campylobacterota bacterium]
MFQNFNNNEQDEKEKQNSIDKNLKMMSISAVVLIVLFIYTTIKSENALVGTSYYVGVIFLFILLFLTFFLQKYKSKIRKVIPDNRFQKELDSTLKKNNNEQNTKREDSHGLLIESINSNVSFKDIAGIDKIKDELYELVDFINNPKKYQKYGVSLPKGVLLVGPPGVGKTLIAKAIAGEADVPFFYQSGASFVHIYVGMGAKRVKDLFSIAKAKAPSIIFIDEIDSVGKSRGIGANEERESTLNELLTQMDGFDNKSGVMVIAATNKIEVLDDALLRAGRFDRRVFLSLPNKDDRLKILNLYLKDKKYDFNLEKLAIDTSGFNSSALATLINEALLNMIKRDGKSILEEDIEKTKQKIEFGTKQLSLLNNKEKEILAIYQAGKAFFTKSKVSLFDSGVSNKELAYPSKSELEKKIKNYLSGSVTLEVLKNESYAIFPEEISEAYKIADDMVSIYKMDTSSEIIINRVRTSLITDINLNNEEIIRLKELLLKDEVVL